MPRGKKKKINEINSSVAEAKSLREDTNNAILPVISTIKECRKMVNTLVKVRTVTDDTSLKLFIDSEIAIYLDITKALRKMAFPDSDRSEPIPVVDRAGKSLSA